jgi:hypothetical protein
MIRLMSTKLSMQMHGKLKKIQARELKEFITW